MKEYSDKIRVVFDTNIYIAAFLRAGLADFLLKLSNEKKFQLFISQEIFGEIERKLHQKNSMENQINGFLNYLHKSARSITVKENNETRLVRDDPEDDKIIECALAAEAHIIVSMDKHLLRIKEYKGIKIIHPKTLSWMIPDY